VIGISLDTRRPPMLRAQMLDVAQPRRGLIVMTIGPLLDHRFRRQPRHAAASCRDPSPANSRLNRRGIPPAIGTASDDEKAAGIQRLFLLMFRSLLEGLRR
jgi:hypothetical protein